MLAVLLFNGRTILPDKWLAILSFNLLHYLLSHKSCKKVKPRNSNVQWLYYSEKDLAENSKKFITLQQNMDLCEDACSL